MRSELSRRIAKMEHRSFAPATIRLAYMNFVSHGIEPTNPKLQQVVVALAATLAAIERNANGLDHEQHQNPD